MNRQMVTRRKIVQYVFVAFVAVTLASCSTFSPDNASSNTRYSASEPFVFGYGVAEEGHFEMIAVNGSIEIIAIEGSTSIDIWGERTVKSESREDAVAHIEGIEFIVDQGRYDIVFETKVPTECSGREYQVEYHVRIPKGWDVVLHHHNGEIHAGSLTSALSVDLANGDVVFDCVDGDVSTNVMNGTIAGNVLLTCGNSCNLTITNGDIDLFIPDDLSAVLTAEVVNGSVDVRELQIQDLNESTDGVCGCLGDGEKSVDLSAVNGTIRVRAR